MWISQTEKVKQNTKLVQESKNNIRQPNFETLILAL